VNNEKGVANSVSRGVSRGVRPVLWRGGAGCLQKIFASPRVGDVYLRKGECEKKSNNNMEGTPPLRGVPYPTL